MIVLFVNAHKDDEQGNTRFKIYYDNIRNLLKESVFYGNEVEQVIRDKTQLEDFLYDETSYRCDQKAKQKFQSVEYVFIDGSTSVPPWAASMKQVLLLIKMCMRARKKFHFNGSAHFGLYFYMTTKFEKDYLILSEKAARKSEARPDYEFNQETGDLYLHGKKVCHSGIKCLKTNSRPFSAKSSQALSKGVILPTKFHYLVFDAKNGHKILGNIRFPFTFFFKGRVFCTPKQISQAKVSVLVQTQNKIPLAFTAGEGLSTHGLSAEFLKMISNWLYETTGSADRNTNNREFRQFKEISVENKFNYKRNLYSTVNHNLSQQHNRSSLLPEKSMILQEKGTPIYSRIYSAKSRPKSSKFSRITFDKPSLRCSGPYETENERYNSDMRVSRSKIVGRSRIDCEGNMSRYEIKNYVHQSESRPPSAHKFRDVHKDKWLDKQTFFLS